MSANNYCMAVSHHFLAANEVMRKSQRGDKNVSSGPVAARLTTFRLCRYTHTNHVWHVIPKRVVVIASLVS